MKHLEFERMHLYVAQQHSLSLPVYVHRKYGSMEGFQLELVIKFVIVKLDRLRWIFSAVDDSRHLAGTTQAAARNFALQVALLRADFNLHLFSPKCGSPATR